MPEGFGYGCSLQEHILYGQCLDGRCSMRANWESIAAREATLKQKELAKSVRRVTMRETLRFQDGGGGYIYSSNPTLSPLPCTHGPLPITVARARDTRDFACVRVHVACAFCDKGQCSHV